MLKTVHSQRLALWRHDGENASLKLLLLLLVIGRLPWLRPVQRQPIAAGLCVQLQPQNIFPKAARGQANRRHDHVKEYGEPETTHARISFIGTSMTRRRTEKALLKQTVDERSERRAFCRHQQHPQDEEEENNWDQPPFLADFQKVPEFFQDGKFAVHGDTRVVIVSKSRRAIILLPSALGRTESPSK